MASLEAGRRLAERYLLENRLGDGGHAEVWAAADAQSGQRVALKFLHPGACSVDEAMPVLRHEARMARFLDHPRVLRVEEPLRDGDVAFLPMEYAPGGNAAQLRGTTWRRIVPVLIEVARVLEHAHARGVVHRDIKPGNVLFAADGSVRVADFGTSTRTGSRDAPATGSPFSASPQQLRGEGGSPADDVYGLGALAHELLTRYPPFYPHFDALQVQEQDPPRPVPAQPAPVELLDLVQAMLARAADERPTLAGTVDRLQHFLAATGLPEEEGVTVVEAAAAEAARAERVPRSSQLWWWGLLAAAAAGLAALLLLPGPTVDETRPAIAAIASPPSVADALVVEPPAGAAAVDATAAGTPGEAAGSAAATQGQTQTTTAAADATDAPALPTLADELRAGQQALDALRPAEATAAFHRALAIEADHAAAREGLAVAVRQQELLARLAEGTRAEAAGELDVARDLFRGLLLTQPQFTPARNALARVEGRLADATLEQHLGRAAEALQLGNVESAEQAYAQAAALRAGDARVLDGQQRIAEIHRDRRNAADLATGAELEAAERWEAAVAHYRSTLEREAELRFAQEGLVRSERRLALDLELADYQARPQRLTAPLVRQAAQRALARGTSTATADESPRLRAQLAWLRTQLEMLDEPVRLELVSDNHTEVRVLQVGALGRFEMHELNLPPGQYTIIGQREGFRDVRVELNLAPGQRQAALSVRCTEPI